jgi:UDP-N-acetylmuramate dehydrogenase
MAGQADTSSDWALLANRDTKERQVMVRDFRAQAGLPLRERTTLGLGGPAEYFAEVAGVEALREALLWAERRSLPVTVLGGGSNVVVAEGGIPGLVLSVGLDEEIAQEHGEFVDVRVGAGRAWDDLVAGAVKRNWAGLECLSGIPGRVGATPIQNVGAYGQEVAETVRAVDVFDRGRASLEELAHADCKFGYRTSRFKTSDAGRFIVLAVTFRLRIGGRACVAYPEIAKQFPARPPALAEVRSAVLATRRQKSMLLDPSDENGRSCGSFFLNPELEGPALQDLQARSATPPPFFPQPDGRFKVPAAWLIEQAGFRRGQRWGTVGISSRHSLALVCHAGATSRALLEAAHRVRDGVAEAFGLWLQPEPQFLGFGTTSDGLPALSSFE